MIENIKKDSEVPGHNDLIQFVDSHRVALEAGDYTVTITQKVTNESVDWVKRHDFSVRGERFFLPPSAVQSAFPPVSSMGDYWEVLPHIVLDRSTLPWERTALKDGKSPETDPPWLALLVFHQDDPAPEVKNVGIAEFLKSNQLTAEGENGNEKIQVITVPTQLLPTQQELPHLTHVRRRLALVDTGDKHATDFVKEHFPHAVESTISEGGITGNLYRDPISDESFEVIINGKGVLQLFHVAHEAASLIANRLPMPGASNTVHLVSMEGIYPIDTNVVTKVDLVSLFQWSFYCENESVTFGTLAQNLDNKEWGIDIPNADDISQKYLNAGYTPLRHRFREGSRSISWYHGPLIPSDAVMDTDTFQVRDKKTGQVIDQDIKFADQLVVLNTKQGMFDVSNAAAWELGRLLTLQNTKIALATYNWKRQHAHNLHTLRHIAEYGYHLAGANDILLEDPDAKIIEDWLGDLTLLKHIPFNYLVPDERLLPAESIRFFQIDSTWIKFLRDGAFSVGEALALDENLAQPGQAADIYTGFLLRSELVSGWPKLLMTAYEKGHTPKQTDQPVVLPNKQDQGILVPIRKEKLSPQVLLVIFKGVIESVDFFLPPETLHFGFKVPKTIVEKPISNRPDALLKALRDADKGMILIPEQIVDISIRNNDTKQRLVDIAELVTKKQIEGKENTIDKPEGSGKLALQLVAGNELIRINRNLKTQ